MRRFYGKIIGKSVSKNKLNKGRLVIIYVFFNRQNFLRDVLVLLYINDEGNWMKHCFDYKPKSWVLFMEGETREDWLGINCAQIDIYCL